MSTPEQSSPARKPLPDLRGCMGEVLSAERELEELLPTVAEVVQRAVDARGRYEARWEIEMLYDGGFPPLDLRPSSACARLDELSQQLRESVRRLDAS